MTLLVHIGHSDDDLEQLRGDASRLEEALRARMGELDATRTDLETFRLRYHREVGMLHEQLDDLELAIAEAELGELTAKLAAAPADAAGAVHPEPAETPARYTSDAIRKLFRDVAKLIHPDLDRDAAARDERHALMVEANRAYLLGDEEQLRWILAAWESRPDALRGGSPEAVRERLERRRAYLEQQLARLDEELAELRATPLWELKVMVDQAAVRGRDIVGDMVQRLQRDIMAATNRLDAMRPPS